MLRIRNFKGKVSNHQLRKYKQTNQIGQKYKNFNKKMVEYEITKLRLASILTRKEKFNLI